MIIRKAIREDLFLAAKVQVESNRTTYKGIMPEEYLNNLSYEAKAKEWDARLFGKDSIEVMYVAEADTEDIVGFASVSLVRTNDLFERELYSIYILKDYQGKGIGKSLIKEIAASLVRENIKSLILWTLQANPSRLFYDHLGGKIVAERFIDRGGEKLLQIAYGWEDITCV